MAAHGWHKAWSRAAFKQGGFLWDLLFVYDTAYFIRSGSSLIVLQ